MRGILGEHNYNLGEEHIDDVAAARREFLVRADGSYALVGKGRRKWEALDYWQTDPPDSRQGIENVKQDFVSEGDVPGTGMVRFHRKPPKRR